MRKLAAVIVAVILGIFFYSTACLPTVGDPASAPNTHVSDYYIEHSFEDTGSPNIVTGTLADYRGFDTLEETTVMFLAGLTTVLLLRWGKDQEKDQEKEGDDTL